MKSHTMLITALLLVLSAIAHAEQNFHGYFAGVKGRRLMLDIPHVGKRSFGINDQTTALNEGRVFPLKRIPIESKIRIIERNGVAEVLIVERMPR